MNQLLTQYHQQLNHPLVVPGEWYRRNAIHYPLLCYINTIIGLYLSANLDLVPLFLDRAWQHVHENEGVLANTPYGQLLTAYLPLMAKYILSHQTLDPVARGLLPEELVRRATTIEA
jgi:hypothetical protein